MEAWRGLMNWPREKGWSCEICGGTTLIWGLLHARCRCVHCHTQYHMRDESDSVVTKPICMLKPNYFAAFKKLWPELRVYIEDVTDEQWEAALRNTELEEVNDDTDKPVPAA